MNRFSTGLAALCAVFAVTGCSSKRIEAPEPDMSRLVIVNKTIPADLVGRPEVVLPQHALSEGEE